MLTWPMPAAPCIAVSPTEFCASVSAPARTSCITDSSAPPRAAFMSAVAPASAGSPISSAAAPPRRRERQSPAPSPAAAALHKEHAAEAADGGNCGSASSCVGDDKRAPRPPPSALSAEHTPRSRPRSTLAREAARAGSLSATSDRSLSAARRSASMRSGIEAACSWRADLASGPLSAASSASSSSSMDHTAPPCRIDLSPRQHTRSKHVAAGQETIEAI
jgi:hypothetical protein